jgi:hypothetical protein
MFYLKTAMRFGVGAVISALAINANATSPDFTSLTSAVDFTTVIAAVLLVAAAIAGVDIVIKGAKIILRALRGA